MKKIKSFISLFLASLFIMQAVPVFANGQDLRDDGFIHHEIVDENFNVVEEVYEFDGSIFYFLMTAEYTYSSQLTPEGFYHFAFSYRDSGVVSSGNLILENLQILDYSLPESNLISDEKISTRVSIDNFTRNNSLIVSSFILDNMDEYVTNVESFEAIHYDSEVQEVEFSDTNSISRMSLGRAYHTIEDLIRAEYSPIYFNRSLGGISTTRNGIHVRCTLLESYTIYYRRQSTRWFDAGVSLGVISTLTGFSTAGLMSIISWSTGVAGLLISLYGFFFGDWVVEENYTRNAFIDNGVWYWSGRTITTRLASGNAGYARNTSWYPSERIHSDFYDVYGIMYTAIDNYIGWRS